VSSENPDVTSEEVIVGPRRYRFAGLLKCAECAVALLSSMVAVATVQIARSNEREWKKDLSCLWQSRFLGEEELAHFVGAGGPAWTERLPVRFEWLAAA
jgi:hypothetical protein